MSIADVPEPAPESPPGSGPGDGVDRPEDDPTTLIGMTVVLLAGAGLLALVASSFLLGALRLSAGILAALGAGGLALALMTGLRRPRRAVHARRAIAFAVAVVLALALTIPALLAHRPAGLDAVTVSRIAALDEDDQVIALPAALAETAGTAAEGSAAEGSESGDGAESGQRIPPVLVRRAEGGAQLLIGERVDEIDAAPDDVLALSSDGTRLLRVTVGGSVSTTVLAVSADAAPSEETRLDGAPIALDGDLLVLRSCSEGSCRISGHDIADMADPSEAVWSIYDGDGDDPLDGTRGVDGIGVEVPVMAGAGTGGSAGTDGQGLLDGVSDSGLLPSVLVTHDAVQGWVQRDVMTGLSVGGVLAGAQDRCRVAETAVSPGSAAGRALSSGAGVSALGADGTAVKLVVTVCADDDGAMTATAFREGRELWRSDPSPAGEWSVRADGGRVLADGIEEGAEGEGELVASESSSSWTAPGGDVLDQAEEVVSRTGIDGTAMVVDNASWQLLAYDTASGENLWTLPLLLDSEGAGSVPEGTTPTAVRGALGSGTAVVLTAQVRRVALDGRGVQVLRVIDVADGDVTASATVDRRTAEAIDAIVPVGAGRALVTVDEETLLIGAGAL